MVETKLGISVGLLSALCFWVGKISIIAIIVLVIYILYMEQDQVLRYNALSALMIAIIFSLLGSLFFIIDLPLDLDRWIRQLLNILEFIILVTSGFIALKNKKVKVAIITDWLDKNVLNENNIKL